MMKMLSVITSRDLTTAHAKVDFLGMEITALVTICNKVKFNASLPRGCNISG